MVYGFSPFLASPIGRQCAPPRRPIQITVFVKQLYFESAPSQLGSGAGHAAKGAAVPASKSVSNWTPCLGPAVPRLARSGELLRDARCTGTALLMRLVHPRVLCTAQFPRRRHIGGHWERVRVGETQDAVYIWLRGSLGPFSGRRRGRGTKMVHFLRSA